MAKKDSKKYITSVSAFNGKRGLPKTNTPTQYNDRQEQYMADRTATFDAYRAYLSTDYVNAEVQGVVRGDFYEWVNTNIRLADIANPSPTASKPNDDYKQVLFADLEIDYFPIGAKIKTMGSVWLCVNPSNISSVKTKAVVARCNASYNSYDYYGNVVSEPIVIESYSMLSNNNAQKSSIVLMNGYFNVTCQLNENTAQLKENSRIILGKKAYYITGMTDFIQEFTGDRESCHLLNFTVRVEEPTESDDITVNFIAGGNEYDFDCILQAVDNMSVGEIVPFTAYFVKNGDFVEPTKEKPITWIWESSDNSVATVDEYGNVTAKSIGKALITAKMAQNKDINATAELVIKETQIGEKKVVFTSVLPESLSQYESIVISAIYKESGKATNEPIEWFFEGADSEEDYSVEVSADKMSVKVTCISPSDNNLEVTASCKGVSITATIELLGY